MWKTTNIAQLMYIEIFIKVKEMLICSATYEFPSKYYFADVIEQNKINLLTLKLNMLQFSELWTEHCWGEMKCWRNTLIFNCWNNFPDLNWWHWINLFNLTITDDINLVIKMNTFSEFKPLNIAMKGVMEEFETWTNTEPPYKSIASNNQNDNRKLSRKPGLIDNPAEGNGTTWR